MSPHLLSLRDTAPADASLWAALLNRAGTYFLGRTDHAQAESLFREALGIRGDILSSLHPFTAILPGNLVNLLQLQGEFARMRPFCERALAMLTRDRDNFVTARPFYERARAILEQVLGPEDPHAERVRSNYARLLIAAGHRAEVVSLAAAATVALAEAALAAHDTAFGPSHPWTRDSAPVAAAALDALARNAEADVLRARYALGQG